MENYSYTYRGYILTPEEVYEYTWNSNDPACRSLSIQDIKNRITEAGYLIEAFRPPRHNEYYFDSCSAKIEFWNLMNSYEDIPRFIVSKKPEELSSVINFLKINPDFMINTEYIQGEWVLSLQRKNYKLLLTVSNKSFKGAWEKLNSMLA